MGKVVFEKLSLDRPVEVNKGGPGVTYHFDNLVIHVDGSLSPVWWNRTLE